MSRRLSALGSLALVLLAVDGGVRAQVAPNGERTVFRYRSFMGAPPGWVSHIVTSDIDHSVGSNDIDVIDRGEGFTDLFSTDFNGVDEDLRGASSVHTFDNSGDDSFTIQAWFFADAVDGYRTLMSNTASNNGFSLKVKDGQLRGLVRLDDGGSPVSAELLGGTVASGRWSRAAFRVRRTGATHELKLWLDGVEVASTLVDPSLGDVRQSAEPPMVGAEPLSQVGDDHFFDGRIYAVAIQNYAVDDAYLTSDPIRDGSRYLGQGSYHDYLDGTKGPDHRIAETIAPYPDLDDVVARHDAPFLNDEYIPQGLATDGVDRLYMSMYWKDADGVDGLHPSILAEMTDTGELVTVRRLLDSGGGDFTGHVGGAAWWNDRIYVPFGDDVYRYDLTSSGGYVFDPETFANPLGDQNDMQPDAIYADCNLASNTKISFLSISVDFDGTPVLWTGAFSETAIEEIIGFAIDGSGHIDPTTFQHQYTLPVTKAQGIECYEATDTQLGFYVSRSFGDNTSTLTEARYTRGTPGHDWSHTLFSGPAGLEDLGMIGTRLWTVSESGAKYFQKRTSPSPWDMLYPYVFALETDRWVDLGSALPGATGPPLLEGSGSLTPGSEGQLAFSGAAASAPAMLFLSLASTPFPFKGGTLLPVPWILTIDLVTNGAGAVDLPFTWPTDLPPDTEFFVQVACADAGAVKGVSLSNGLSAVAP